MIFPIFKDKDDLERTTNISILGEICTADKKSGKIVVGENDSTPIAEMFRLVRNNMQFALTGNDKKVILITSSLSGEGKTFIASNIALSFALTGKKTVVVGLDIRRPVLSHLFNIKNEIGATTYLSGNCSDLNDIIFSSGYDNLDIIPGGPTPPNPNELLLSAKLKEVYDYVIVDTAPIGVVSDSYLIAPHVDLQLYVTRANFSTKRCLKIMHNAVETKRLSNCYLVLNGVNVKSSSYNYRRYGRYGRYGGKYGYGYSYGETPSLSSRIKRLFRKSSR